MPNTAAARHLRLAIGMLITAGGGNSMLTELQNGMIRVAVDLHCAPEDAEALRRLLPYRHVDLASASHAGTLPAQRKRSIGPRRTDRTGA